MVKAPFLLSFSSHCRSGIPERLTAVATVLTQLPNLPALRLRELKTLL
jgi:hypothetical protein